MQTDFKLYKVDMKYIRNLHNIDNKVLSVSPQTGKDNRVFVGIVIICGIHKYCIPLSSPKEKHKKNEEFNRFFKDWDKWKTVRRPEFQFDDTYWTRTITACWYNHF